jgi:hypothetical protein
MANVVGTCEDQQNHQCAQHAVSERFIKVIKIELRHDKAVAWLTFRHVHMSSKLSPRQLSIFNREPGQGPKDLSEQAGR